MKITAETFHTAIEFATKAHRGQFRKDDKTPYITHPIKVMSRVMSIKESSNLFLLGTAAILHDVVEDCNVTLEEIRQLFGYYVAGLVEELTLNKSKYETIGKKEYLAQEVVGMSSYALCLKLCDRLENVLDMKKMGDTFKRNYTAETLYILERLESKRSNITKTHAKLIDLIKSELEQYSYLLV